MLTGLLEDLDPVKKSDRLGLIKQKGFTLLTGLLAEEAQWEALFEWTTRWVEFSHKNITAQLRIPHGVRAKRILV